MMDTHSKHLAELVTERCDGKGDFYGLRPFMLRDDIWALKLWNNTNEIEMVAACIHNDGQLTLALIGLMAYIGDELYKNVRSCYPMGLFPALIIPLGGCPVAKTLPDDFDVYWLSPEYELLVNLCDDKPEAE